MNCKPDQLCRVLRGEHAQVIVTTIRRCTCLKDVIKPTWECEAMQSVTVNGKTHPPGVHVCVADNNLKPLGGEGKDPHDVTVKDKFNVTVRTESGAKRVIKIMPVKEEA